MQTYHFKEVVSPNGVVTLSGLPAHREVQIVVIYPELIDFQAELKRWLDDISQRHPLAKLSKEEILAKLRQTREKVYDELYSGVYAD